MNGSSDVIYSLFIRRTVFFFSHPWKPLRDEEIGDIGDIA